MILGVLATVCVVMAFVEFENIRSFFGLGGGAIESEEVLGAEGVLVEEELLVDAFGLGKWQAGMVGNLEPIWFEMFVKGRVERVGQWQVYTTKDLKSVLKYREKRAEIGANVQVRVSANGESVVKCELRRLSEQDVACFRAQVEGVKSVIGE